MTDVLDRVKKHPSVAVQRLIDEVRNTPAPKDSTQMYNRVYTRHNRS